MKDPPLVCEWSDEKELPRWKNQEWLAILRFFFIRRLM
jgi:hypothetical protein